MKHALERGGDLNVELVGAGAAALKAVMEEPPGLVLLDLNLPFIDGLEVCRLLRSRASSAAIPIIMVTARTGETDLVSGLEMGADDYVTKPFSLRELVARVRALLRRAGVADAEVPGVLEASGVRLDPERHEVRIRGVLENLPLKEFELLETLLENRGRVLTRQTLIDRVWGFDYVGDTKTLDVHVKRLRSRIEQDRHEPKLIVTVRGVGYRFDG